MRYGTGFEGRLSLSPRWKLSGDLTVTLQGVKPEDQGDFFCYVQDKDPTRPREGLSAVRLKIREKNPDQTTCPPPTAAAGICLTKKEMITWIVVCIVVCILAVVLMALAFCYGRFWKPNVPSGPGGGTGPAPTDGTDVEMQPLAEPRPPGSHVNGGLRPIANGNQDEDQIRDDHQQQQHPPEAQILHKLLPGGPVAGQDALTALQVGVE
ncbi:uncharacterized protein LOC120573120 [Perca fluviatilis]|uniref:uncharacterized protein LOC120573120 n=1 Tax=Perca fluviatilis TaxID=8168 RepID=UPI001966B656|nr:uncharacterized protein LOC120573120 [Perca fluviatilis]